MFKKIKDVANDLLGNKHEAVESLEEALKERMTSPFYGYFLISWLIVNWDFIYSALTIDQNLLFQKEGLLRNEYLLQNILPPQHSLEWFFDFLIEPFILTIIVFWIMPYITREFYRQHVKNISRLEKIRIDATTQKTKAETELINEKLKHVQAERKADEIDPKISWERDFSEFKETEIYRKFYQILRSYYKQNSWIKSDGNSIDLDILAYADSNGLVDIGEDDYQNAIIKPTEKGRFFFKLYLDDPNSQKEEYPF